MAKDIDYYLFWAEEFIQEHFDDLVLLESMTQVQIKCSHILMDSGQIKDYQEDGFELGEIIWEMLVSMRKNNGGYHN
jgi:hypothetical protein